MSTDQHSHTLPILTEHGTFLAHYSEQGLCALNFPRKQSAHSATNGASQAAPAEVAAWHKKTTAALGCVLAGQPIADWPPLDISAGTQFQRDVWQAMQELGPGKTCSYSELAGRIGRPKAVRAVGGACGANPIPVLIPCHRVLAAGNKLGGFSAGLEWKKLLLGIESARI